jgi:hypothetical protein
LSKTDTLATFFHGWQTLAFSLAIGPLNLRPLLQWLPQSPGNRHTVPFQSICQAL